MGPRARDAPNSRESCFFGSGFASWVRAQVKSTWGPGLLSISKQALRFSGPCPKKTPSWSRERPWPEQLRYVPVITQHPSPITHGASKISTPLLALLSSIHTASRRTTHSTPLHSIRTRDPLTPLRNHSTSIEQIGESIINCPPPSPLDSLLSRTVAVAHPVGICIRF
jgi:hypothetical protein